MIHQSAAVLETPALTSPELEVLEVCREVVARQHEMLPLLADALQVPQSEVFYTWAHRRCAQHGELQGTDWWYFFHGLECDLKNRADQRILRIDFGPGGSVDTFTAWGVLQFIMTSAAPWPDYALLKQRFAPPSKESFGDFHKLGEVWDALHAKGVLEGAALDLVAFQARHTRVGPEGINIIEYPSDTPERVQIDCAVAARSRLSQQGLRVLSLRANANNQAVNGP